MKKVFILPMIVLIFSTIISCDDDDDYEEITAVYATKIDSVQIPTDTMFLGMTQEMKVYSTFAKSCEGIYSYDYQYTNDSVRTVINYAFKTNAPCADGTYVDGSRIHFKPLTTGTYTFKFFAGKDGAGANTFLEKKVVVE
ncbi:hypothetical protein [Chryseobacterium sp. SC28]|uniref:hypothetical protein n=1 Tax=Chryseobacterium sp. SC28 TaxID=2268028 RepID=UPI000F649533|nr:hypothetical protein [Chryseobacterium sp. SC28]RRQ45353.1 hypothetical protein DTW91_10820 [Chryseobacterium sp. SC28]